MKNYFINIPKVIFNSSVSSSAKVLYCHLIWIGSECDTTKLNKTNKELAKLMGISVITISRLIKELKSVNLISTFNRNLEDNFGNVISWERVILINMDGLEYEVH